MTIDDPLDSAQFENAEDWDVSDSDELEEGSFYDAEDANSVSHVAAQHM